MKIAIINESNGGGSAYKVVSGLCRELRDRGCDATLYARLVRESAPYAQSIDFPGDPRSRVRRMMRRLRLAPDARRFRHAQEYGHEVFHGDRTQYGRGLLNALPDVDVINFQFVWNIVDHEAIVGNCATPIVWTIHDMNVFTGGCHYDGGCGRFRTGCGRCPQLRSKVDKDCTSRVWARKRKAFDKLGRHELHLVAPSKWMASMIAESPLLNRFPCHVIPYGADLKTFQPRDRVLAREVLGLPADKRLVLFVAQSLSNRRKGFELLVQALRLLGEDHHLALVSVGNAPAKLSLSVPYYPLGYFDKDGLLSLVYSAADLFVIPSLEDNLPCTVMESMACGTPVVGFDSGGVSDLVRDNETGFLAPSGDVQSLADAMHRLLADRELSGRLRTSCRRVAENEYSGKQQAARYADLFRQAVESFDKLPVGTQG